MGFFKAAFKTIFTVGVATLGIALGNPQLSILSLQSLKIFAIGTGLSLGLLGYNKLVENDPAAALDLDTSRTIYGSAQPARFAYGCSRVNGQLINISNTEDTTNNPTDILRQVAGGRIVNNRDDLNKINEILAERQNDVIYATYVIATHSVNRIKRIILNSHELLPAGDMVGNGSQVPRAPFSGLARIAHRLNVDEEIPSIMRVESNTILWVYKVRIQVLQGDMSQSFNLRTTREFHDYRLYLNQREPEDTQEALSEFFISGTHAVRNEIQYFQQIDAGRNNVISEGGIGNSFTGLQTGDYAKGSLAFGFLPSRFTEANDLALVGLKLTADTDDKRERWRDFGGISVVNRVQFEIEGINDAITNINIHDDGTYDVDRGYTDNPISIAHHIVTRTFNIYEEDHIDIPKLKQAIDIADAAGYTANGFGDFRGLSNTLLSILSQARGYMQKDGLTSFVSYVPNLPVFTTIKTSEFGRIENIILENDASFENGATARFRDSQRQWDFTGTGTVRHPTFRAGDVSSVRDYGTLESVITQEEARKTLQYELNKSIYSRTFVGTLSTAKLNEIETTVSQNNMQVNSDPIQINGMDVILEDIQHTILTDFVVGSIVEIEDDLGNFPSLVGRWTVDSVGYSQTKALLVTFKDARNEIYEGV